MKKILAALTATSLLALTACNSPSEQPATSAPTFTPGTPYTWEAGDYPSDAPPLFTAEDPTSKNGWYMGWREEVQNNDTSQAGNFNKWQTIYSYKDAADPRGATVAVVFYTDLERCTMDSSVAFRAVQLFSDWVMQDRSGLNTKAYYEYVFSGEGRTFPHPNDETSVGPAVGKNDESFGLINRDNPDSRNSEVEGAELYYLNASSVKGVKSADAIGTPGRTADFFANYTEDSNGEAVATGCATVYTALSTEAAQIYDAEKFKQAYEQGIEFAKEIQSMPQKVPVAS